VDLEPLQGAEPEMKQAMVKKNEEEQIDIIEKWGSSKRTSSGSTA